MPPLVVVLIEIAVAVAFGTLLQKLHLPGGMLIGAILGIAILNLGFSIGYAPSWFKLIAQIFTGAYLGCSMTRDEVKEIPKVIGPVLLSTLGFFVLCLCCAFGFEKIAGLDTLTSLFCALPGGLTDTPLVAMDMGAQVGIVVAAQLVRAIYGIACLPLVVLAADKVLAPKLGVPSVRERDELKAKRKKPDKALLMMLITLLVATAGAFFGKWLSIPAGAFTFALIFAMIFNLKTDKGYSPRPLRRVAQVLSGICIGIRITRGELATMTKMVPALIILVIGYTLFCLAMGCLFAMKFHMGLREGMLSVSPAGATEVTLVAADMDVVSSKLLVMHVFRLITAMVLFPQRFRIYLALRGIPL